MLKAIKMALEYKDILPYAIDLFKTIKESAEDKKLSAKERDRILKSFWALVNEYRAMKKRKAA
jgi:hypothetical protein